MTRIANVTPAPEEHEDTVDDFDPVVTLQMIRQGVKVFFAWNPELEEPEALVMAVYCAMVREAR